MAGPLEPQNFMKQVLIIGAGQLGSRHLQGLARSSQPLSIHLLDPSTESLARARQRFEEIDGWQRHSLSTVASAADLPPSIDLAISATTSDHRLASLKTVLAATRVDALVLEKVLFRSLEEYADAEDLLAKHGVRTWVNCARRMFPGYQALKEFFADDTPQLLQVTGGEWGLGCNGIHFVDLFAFLVGTTAIEFSTAELDPIVHPGKRAGFAEYSGALVGRAASRQLLLQSTHGGRQRHLILIRSAGRTALVDEVAGAVRLLDEQAGTWDEQAFRCPYQSELTAQIADQVLAGHELNLPSFAESAQLHKSFISALLDHHNRHSGEIETSICPIT